MTLLIKNGLIYDGTEAQPVTADILVRGAKIVRIGSFPRLRADEVYDAQGAFVTPGFIDVSARADQAYMLMEPEFLKYYLRQGVTSIIVGSDGASLAPFFSSTLSYFEDWGARESLNIAWRGTAEFLQTLRSLRLPVNIGTLTGYNAIRGAITGHKTRGLIQGETDLIKTIVMQAVREGSFGISFSTHSNKSPSCDMHEYYETARFARGAGIISAYSLHEIKADVLSGVRQLLEVSKDTGVRTLFTELQASNLLQDYYEDLYQSVDFTEASAQTYISFVPYNYAAATIRSLLPFELASLSRPEFMAVINKLPHDPKLKSKLKSYLTNEVVVAAMPRVFRVYLFKTLENLSASLNLSPVELLIQIILKTRARGTVFLKSSTKKIINTFTPAPFAFLSSGAFVLSARAAESDWRSPIASYLQNLAEEPNEKIASFIAKLSGKPANFLRLNQRGLIREGYAADLVIMKDYKPSQVFVNGVLAYSAENEVHSGSGTTLRPLL